MLDAAKFNYAKWIRWTFLGWFVGIVLVLIFSMLFDGIGLEGFQFAVGLGMGGGVGYFQYRYLRKIGVSGSHWFWYSFIGLGAPFLLYDLMFKLNDTPATSNHLPVSVITGSIVVSLLQFRFLKTMSHCATIWLMGGVVSWVLAMATVLSIDYLKNILDNRWVLFSINLIMIFGGGAVLGVVSGWFLKKIMDDSNPVRI